MRQLSRIAALLVGLAVVCVVSGCGSGGTERAQGMHHAVFTFQIQPGDGVAGLVAPRGQTTPVDNVSLKSADPIPNPSPPPADIPGTGVLADGDVVRGWVSVVNDNAFAITGVSVSLTTPPTGWTSNDAVWNYSAVDAGPGSESAPIRWVFCWTGGGAPQAATFQVTVFWSPGSMPPLASDFSLPIDLAMGANTDTIICGTQAGATDTYDQGTDKPLPPGPPGTWVRGYMPHPEWQAIVFGTPTENFSEDIRETLLTGGQTKTWDFVVQSNASSPQSVTLTWSTAGLPGGISAQVIDVAGVGGPAMSVISLPFMFTHPGNYGLEWFQLAVSAT